MQAGRKKIAARVVNEMNRDEARVRMEELGLEQIRHMVYTGAWPTALHSYAIEWMAEKERAAEQRREQVGP